MVYRRSSTLDPIRAGNQARWHSDAESVNLTDVFPSRRAICAAGHISQFMRNECTSLIPRHPPYPVIRRIRASSGPSV